jgi:hypothetical protein
MFDAARGHDLLHAFVLDLPLGITDYGIKETPGNIAFPGVDTLSYTTVNTLENYLEQFIPCKGLFVILDFLTVYPLNNSEKSRTLSFSKAGKRS